MTRYIIRTRNPPSIDVCDFCVNHIHAPNLGIFAHVVESTDLPRAMASIKEEILGTSVEQVYSIPPQVKTQGATVTLNQTLTDIGFPHIWADPEYGGGAGLGYVIKEGHADTGIDESHNGVESPFVEGPAQPGYPPAPGFKSRVVAKFDYYQGQAKHPHGTWTAEIVGRSPRPDGTWRGAAYGCHFYDARVLDYNGQGSTTSVVDGLNWLAAQDVDVVNMSLGGEHDDVMDQAAEALWAKGIIVCAATGNSGKYPPACDGSVGSPADSNNTLSCGATSAPEQAPSNDGKEFVQTWSSRGPRSDGSKLPFYTVAPGLILQPGFNDPIGSGTSFATPHHTGTVIALLHKLMRTNPSQAKTERAKIVRAVLEATGKELGYKSNFAPADAWCIQGNGRIQADTAYDAIVVTPPPPANNTYSHTFTAPGSYTTEVDVTDANGLKGKATVTIVVSGLPPPVGLAVSVSASPQSGVAPLTVQYVARVSGGVAPYAYSWIPGD